jgi:GMP synthase (glutamine-hydrolysing)
VRPFLLLATRDHDGAADEEYDAYRTFTGLPAHLLRRVRLEQASLTEQLGALHLDDWSGIVLGGSPFTASDQERSPVQQRVEKELAGLLDTVVAEDFPFLGACYGVGVLGLHQGGVVDRTYGERIGRVPVRLTPAGAADPLLSGLPEVFDAFVGHKEAVRDLPPTAVHLATSPDCPVQAFRVGRNVYATQFHPELDGAGLCTRIEVYRHNGYFEPHQAEQLKEMALARPVPEPPRLLQRFVELFAR